MTSKLLGVWVTAAGMFVAAQAFAEPSAQVKVVPSGDYSYTFPDDDLVGSEFGATGYVLRVRPNAMHTMLLRPRTSLVPEILHSAEDL